MTTHDRSEPSIDYFRSAPSEAEAILRRIKGDARRRLVADFLVQGPLEEIPEAWLVHDLSDFLRNFLGRQDPGFRGGEDLPDLLAGQVEIARLSLTSVHCEVTSLRALDQGDGCFTLSMVSEDEYDDGAHVLPRTEYDRCLTAEEVACLFRDAEPSVTEFACGWRLTSDFYPDLDEVARGLGLAESDGEDELSALVEQGERVSPTRAGQGSAKARVTWKGLAPASDPRYDEVDIVLGGEHPRPEPERGRPPEPE